MPIRAVIADFDGLLVDTEGPEFEAWRETYHTHGFDLSFEAWSAGIGTRGVFDPRADLERRLGRALDHGVDQTRRARRRALLDAEGLRPGVKRLLVDADALSLRLGIASSSRRDWVVGFLRGHGIADHFHCVRCAEDVAAVKPAPDLYLAVTETLGVRPDEAIALEDSPNGIAAAKAAGLYCIAVPNGLTRRLPLDAADAVLDSLEDLDLAALIARG